MINLLPDDQRKSIAYARLNTKLLHWCGTGFVVLILVALLWGGGYFYLVSSTASYNKTIDLKRTDLKAQKLEETESRIETFSNNLKLILQVLEKEVLFSKLLRQVGAVMPSGAILQGIDISEVQGGLDLTAAAKDYDTATQIQVNLQDPNNKLFEKVDIVSVSCNNGDEKTTTPTTENTNAPEGAQPAQPTTGDSAAADAISAAYPCDVKLKALFNKDNQYLFIHKTDGEAKNE